MIFINASKYIYKFSKLENYLYIDKYFRLNLASYINDIKTLFSKKNKMKPHTKYIILKKQNSSLLEFSFYECDNHLRFDRNSIDYKLQKFDAKTSHIELITTSN